MCKAAATQHLESTTVRLDKRKGDIGKEPLETRALRMLHPPGFEPTALGLVS